jgi:hypothetical protein
MVSTISSIGALFGSIIGPGLLPVIGTAGGAALGGALFGAAAASILSGGDLGDIANSALSGGISGVAGVGITKWVDLIAENGLQAVLGLTFFRTGTGVALLGLDRPFSPTTPCGCK